MDDRYEDLYRVDAMDEFLCGAYDEEGGQVHCDACGEELRWDSQNRSWRCVNCGYERTRIKYFDYIGANPPGPKCLAQCMENYPLCKRWCPWYKIDPDDPIL